MERELSTWKFDNREEVGLDSTGVLITVAGC